MSQTNRELLEALRTAFPQLFIEVNDDGETSQRLDLERVRQLAGEGNYTDKYGLRWENKPEKFEADSVGKLPTLKHVPSRGITANPDRPTHVLIEGDNYHALQVLSYTHERSVDVIYIDPPYNTGNKDFKYNDRFVDKEDGYRHSKWLSFMAKRLRLAKSLLKDAGLLFISIDENETAQLRLLCDEVFGEGNYVETFVWVKNSTKNNSKTTGCVHEYVLCYAKSLRAIEIYGGAFRKRKEGFDVVTEIALRGKLTGKSFKSISTELVSLYRNNPQLKGIAQYKYVDAGGVYRVSDTSSPGGNGATYDVLHPKTGKPCKRPSGGWRYSESTMRDHLSNGRIAFGEDHNAVPQFKRYLNTVETEVVRSIVQNFDEGKYELEELFGTSPFSYPKPSSLLKWLISLHPNKEAVVLDFFAGSGTTAHAVMQLNAEDGGSRQCLLVTNDEGEFKDDLDNPLPGGICTHVTYPRLKKVIEGYTKPNGEVVDGLGENLEFFQTAFHPTPETRNQTQAFATACVPLLNLKSNCFSVVEQTPEWCLFEGNGKHLFVLLDDIAVESARKRLESVSGAIDAYVFSYESDDDSAQLLSELPNVTVQEIPRPVLNLFHRLRSQ